MYLDEEELEMVARAIGKAREAYIKEIERDGTDYGYFPVSMTVHVLTIDLEEVGQIIYKAMDFEKGK